MMVNGFDEDDTWSDVAVDSCEWKKKRGKKLEIQLESHNSLNNASWHVMRYECQIGGLEIGENSAKARDGHLGCELWSWKLFKI